MAIIIFISVLLLVVVLGIILPDDIDELEPDDDCGMEDMP